jgi:hypothetical protein
MSQKQLSQRFIKVPWVLLLMLTFLTGPSAKDRVEGLPKALLTRAGLKFKCTECHRHVEPDSKSRKLMGEHTEIKMKHGQIWCSACHDSQDKTQLRLREGKLIFFAEVDKLCAECHGMVYRDWKLGIHGKRTGFWNGAKNILICTKCHDAHSPKFKPIPPKSPPRNRFQKKDSKLKGHP